MSAPPPINQAAVDEAQTAEIEDLKGDLHLVASYLRAQGTFIPEGVAEGTEEEKKHPKVSDGCPCWGSQGYRVFPFNGGWHSFRNPNVAIFRASIQRQWGFVDEKPFFQRLVDGEVVDVPWGEAQGEPRQEE